MIDSPDKLYKIKPLEWTEWTGDKWQAEVISGVYNVEANRWEYRSYVGRKIEFECTSIEEGKAAAEAHWRERIMAALVEVE